ncbi:Ni/Fe-hydrogenase cytochrome b subunit [Geomonas paludis]|uniref:Ni/Fe-hydrogenase cytochrome b subunit n=1 Tax=Geomonas paludis TaxID=2740185 RepID=A0A6V8MWR0_9BACT|nr:Ni/Fe-hydrogenase cytochrome b subunit [Geomonas paludis]UPU34901.1 Ni/Fe-hydrogenase cytochrome b subunit [Geomonas paludis]GFO64645.1 Ni/Fe-hydrogenase cytochrome b subunit [Geomonas paludis]
MGHSEEYQKLEGKIFTKSFFILLSVVLLGFYFVGVRYVKGIGAVSNMSDGYPWGIWITYDVATGTAIACGGYAVAILVYIRNRMQYHPMIRSAILTSMFGYGLAGFSVMVDLGRPWNAYNFFIPSKWQANSAMFEVALCVMAYSTVLILEFLPAILTSIEKSKWDRMNAIRNWLHPKIAPDKKTMEDKLEMVRLGAAWLNPRLNKVLIFFIVLGITLPTMHQSSLGSLLLIASTKLHPLWHTGFLPLLFLLNCVFIGYAIAILESIISSYSFKRPFEIEELSGLAGLIPFVTVIWLTVVIGDLSYRGQIHAALKGDFYSGWFMTEFLLVACGSLILFVKKARKSARWLFISASMIVLGGALYRFNVYLIGFNPGQGWRYFPSFAEVMITVGIVALEILGYKVFVALFPVLPNMDLHGAHKKKGHAKKHKGSEAEKHLPAGEAHAH